MDEHGPLQFTGERLIPDDAGSRDIFWEHICRYQFACRFAANRRVLDIACGEGYGSAALLKSGASVIGIDVAEEACRHAARKYGISTMVGDAGKIPLPDDSIDLLVSFETVEHVPEPSVFLSECFRVMAPGALLIMSTPNKPAYQRHCASNEFHCSEMNEQQFASLLNDTFGSSEMYGQCIEWIGWRSPRVLAANNSTWMRITGLRFLKRLIEEHFCPHLSRRALPGYKKDPVGAIMKETTRADLLFNPYLVRPRKAAEREVTIYLIGMARKGAASDGRGHGQIP
jgi:SAM-dependent methyltransferase